ncbi:MAG: DNA polymerase III subunit alpha [Bacteroidales bacterium]|nr:DNA polymerase III subunit alpha [Bacteroidales bacterium]
MAFSHLHVHTQYSILDGLSAIKDLFSRCEELNMPALAITDHGNMYGVKVFMNESRKHPSVKPIIGCEVYVTMHYSHKLKDNEHRKYYHLILLAKNYDGYKNLMKIVSEGHINGMYYGKPRVTHEIIEQYHENLICCSACLAGEIPKNIMAGNIEGAKEAIEWHKKVFGEDYYLEVQLHKTEVSDLPAEAYSRVIEVYDRQKEVNEVIFQLSEECGVKTVATNDVHFVRREDGPVHDRLICLTTNANISDPSRLRYTQQEYLKSEEEMLALFPDHPEAISNVQEIVDKIESYEIDRGHVLPKYEIDPAFMAQIDSYLEKYREIIDEGRYTIKKDKKTGEVIDKTYRGDEFCHSVAYLCHLTFEGARERYGETLNQEQAERLDFELKTICRMGFPDYFLIVQDYIAASRKAGWYVGPGRGSAAGSVVAYCLGITNLDPIRYDLLFERFLNPDRISMPDIDVDFENLPWVHDYVKRTYSNEHVSQVITFGTMAAKSAIKDVARITQLSIDESNRLAKMVPDRLSERVEKEYPFNPKLDELKPGFKSFEKEVEVEDKETGEKTIEKKWFQKGLEEVDVKINLKNCYRLVPEFKEELANGPEVNKEVLYYAQKLEGSVRQVGVHACATIIGRGDLTDYIPISIAKDKETGEDMWISQYDGHFIEEVGMLKMDFLGLNTLSIIKECMNTIKARRGEEFDIEKIPIDDPLTYQLYGRGDTDSVFQFESPGMKKWLQKLQPSRFEDLIAMNALYRPGPMDYIPDFVDRKLGVAPIVYDLPDMEKYLADTYGVTVYQEQVMLLSRQLSSFTKGEADKLRKAMGKKQIAVMQELKEKFMKNGVANGHPEKVLDKIWKDWEKFAQYAFNKSHATCYAWVSYQTGYLKAHYTAEFLAANLTCNLSKMDEIKKIMADCKAHKIKVLNPDVNESDNKFTVNAAGDIRFGLSGIKGFGDNVVQELLRERDENGLFTDIYDFAERMSSMMSKRTFENLLYSGAFDSFGIPRWQYRMPMPNGETFTDALVRYADMVKNDSYDEGASLFGGSEEMKPVRPELPVMKAEPDLMELLRLEKDLVGMYLSSHPLDMYRLEMEQFAGCTCAELPSIIARAQQAKKPCNMNIAGYVTSFEQGVSASGKNWGRAVIEDFDGAYEIRLNGKDYESFFAFFKVHNAIFIEGKIDEKFFVRPEDRKEKGDPDYGFKLRKISMLGTVSEQLVKEFRMLVRADETVDVKALSSLFKANKGATTVSLIVSDPKSGHSVDFICHKYKVRVSVSLTEALDQMGIQWKIVK